MPDPTSERLDRILYILPLAMRDGGVTLGELAAAVGCERADIIRDIEEVTARVYYHASGAADQLQILIEGDRVQAWSGQEFTQPARLSPREGMALGLGLRILAAESRADLRDGILAFARRLDQLLVADTAGWPMNREPAVHYDFDTDQISAARLTESAPPASTREPAPVSLDLGDDGFRSALADAAIQRRRCRILYLRPGQAAPATRVVAPYLLVYASGTWYVLGHDADRDAVRAFRMDRMLHVDVTLDSFEAPADFDASSFIGDAGVYRSSEGEVEVTVRYSPRVARWIEERMPVEAQPDGSVVARHMVGDPSWMVRHVLRYGADARVMEPADMRDRVARAALRISA